MPHTSYNFSTRSPLPSNADSVIYTLIINHNGHQTSSLCLFRPIISAKHLYKLTSFRFHVEDREGLHLSLLGLFVPKHLCLSRAYFKSPPRARWTLRRASNQSESLPSTTHHSSSTLAHWPPSRRRQQFTLPVLIGYHH